MRKFKRRIENLTDYRMRSKLLMGGKPRLVVRHSNRYVYVQFIEYGRGGDLVQAQANSKELLALDFPSTSNTTAAYLTGLLAGMRAKKSGVEEAVLDAGLNVVTKGSRALAALAGAIDAGIEIPHDPSALPRDRVEDKPYSGKIAEVA
jgi:large subunit ribosomal protein L18